MNADTQHVFDSADAMFLQGDFTACQPLFERIVAQHPDGYPDAHNRLGVIHHSTGDLTTAAECFERAIHIHPGYSEAALNLVIAYNDLGRYGEAETVLNATSSRVRESGESAAKAALANRHARLGDDYASVDRLEDALHEYRRALTLRPRYVDIICKVGETLRKLERTDDALRVLHQARDLNPNYAEPYVQMGLIYYRKGFLDMAMKEWIAALERDPSRRDAEAFLATVRRALLQQ